jgi:hypothetical protein
MTDEGPKTYTHAELVELLQRSVALKAESERGYSEAEVAAAAAELGVDPALARKAADELEARRAKRALAPRPFDTRIALEVTDGRLKLRVPPVRPSPATLAPLGFMTFWFAFISFWTVNAARASALFAAFSTPFWIAGLGMLRRFLLPLFQVTTLELGPDGGSLATRPLGRRRALRAGELRVRLGEETRLQQRGMGAASGPEPVILLEHGTETLPLLAGFSEQERRWILAELEAFLPRATT